MVIAWRKQAGAKVYFRHESQMGHEIEPSTSLTNMHPQHLRQKKDVVYGLLFLLHMILQIFHLQTLLKPLSNVFDPDLY